jgi:hypothetical protein
MAENHLAAANRLFKQTEPALPSVIATAGFTRENARPQRFAIRMSDDKKGIFLLSASQLDSGITDAGEPIPIIYADSGGACIVANRAKGLQTASVILDPTTLKGVISYTGLGSEGIEGVSTLISCKGVLPP